MDPRGERSGVPRVLICDDSRTFAVGLKQVLEHDSQIRVERVVGSAEEALRALPIVRPDLVTMDIELPGMNGVEATRLIRAENAVPILVISAATRRGSELAAAALVAGASDAISKEGLGLGAPASPAASAFRHRVRRLARLSAAGSRRHEGAPSAPTGHQSLRPGRRRARVVAIGASTGGPHALREVLSALSADYELPVLVVQHMSSGFTPGLIGWLDRQVPLPVALARDRTALHPGVWFAPEGVHLLLDRSMRMILDAEIDAGLHRPAADVLLESVADAAGSGGVGVVLTGMGSDGARGIAAIRQSGGLTIAQDPLTSVVWGMPQAAVDSGAELVLTLAEIGAALRDLAARAIAR